jgi:hypothetical protein
MGQPYGRRGSVVRGQGVPADVRRAGQTVLQPTPTFEDEVERERRDDHEANRHGVAVVPTEFWHVLEVHPVDGSNERGSEEIAAQAEIFFTSSFCAKLATVRLLISSFCC